MWHPTPTDQITWDSQPVNTTSLFANTASVVGVYVERISGLIGHPPFRVENLNRPSKDGARPGEFRLGARPFTVEGILWGTLADFETRKEALQQVFVADGLVHTFAYTHQAGGLQQVEARIENEFSWGDPAEFGALVGARWIVGFVAHDPRRYGQTVFVEQTANIAASTGFTNPLDNPLRIGGTGVSGALTVPPGGNVSRGAILRVYGPVTSPVIEVLGDEQDRNITFTGLTISPGDVLKIDLDEQTATKSTANSNDYTHLVRALNPAGYWRLGDADSVAVDRMGANDGAYAGTVTKQINGVLLLDADTAVEFDGTTGHVEVPYAAAINPAGTWTIETWVYPTTVTGVQTLVDAITANRGFRLQLNGAVVRIAVGDGASIVTNQTTATVTAGVWSHVVATYDGADVRVYINGVLRLTATVTYANNTSGVTRLASVVGGGSFLGGRLDEVAIYPTELSASVVLDHFQLATKDVQPVTNVYGSIDFMLTRFFLLPPEGVQLRFRGTSVTDPAKLVAEWRDASI